MGFRFSGAVSTASQKPQTTAPLRQAARRPQVPFLSIRSSVPRGPLLRRQRWKSFRSFGKCFQEDSASSQTSEGWPGPKLTHPKGSLGRLGQEPAGRTPEAFAQLSLHRAKTSTGT